MAETAKGSGRILAGDQFEFTLDGLASASQMDKLINAISKSMGGTGTGGASGAAASLKRGRERLEKFNESVDDATKANKEAAKAKEEETKNSEKLNKELYKFKGALHSLGRGSLTGALESIDTIGTRFALGLGTLVGSLTGYADKLTEGLQRGISGGIFDYAIAAKTAGVNIEQFGKAIAESAGGFASLGVGATDGAKQFGALVGSVREATASVGNLGMTNEQIAMFTAQQTKTAISQGFKGKQAQDVVIKNSRALGEELDTLANRTGKSVMELAAAAMKLAQDPIVANFVQTAKSGGGQISKAIQQFGASLRGVFGEAGDAVAADTLKAALGGLPLVITQTGKNMIMASSAVYSELERQANIVKRGGEITAEDQEKLRNTVIKEVEARGAELRMLANLEGPMGESARQLLSLAEQANFYNSAEGAKRRESDKVAQEFNSQIRAFQANMQKLSIPFLTMINSIDWTAFIAVLSGFAKTVGLLLSPLTGLGQVLGAKNIVGTVIGGLFGVAGVVGLLIGAYSLYTGSIRLATASLQKFSAFLMSNFGFSAGNIGGTPGKMGGKLGGVVGTAGVGMLGSGAAAAMMGGPQSTAGSVGSLALGVGGAMAGRAAGASIGAALGATTGPFAPIIAPLASIIGATAGAALGQWLGDKISGAGASADLAGVGADNVGSNTRINQAMLSEQQKTNQFLERQTSEVVAGNYISQRNVAATDSLIKTTRDNRLYS
jgi:hypothetical protein